jgi:hypothetical protein
MLLILTLNFFLTYVFVLQGKVSVADMIAFSPSEVASSKYDGNLLSNKHTTLMSLVNAFFFVSEKVYHCNLTREPTLFPQEL